MILAATIAHSAHLFYWLLAILILAVIAWLISIAIKNFAGVYDNELDRWRERHRKHPSHRSHHPEKEHGLYD